MIRAVDSLEAMDAFGRELAESLRPGDVVGLIGDLGAGKTHLSKAIVAGLGARETVTSPTFTLIHEYLSGRLPVYHFDFYRAEDPGEIVVIGWDDYLDRDGVILVEWADKFPALLPSGARWLQLSVTGPECRTVTFLPAAPES